MKKYEYFEATADVGLKAEVEFMLFSEFHVEIDENLHLKAKIIGEEIDWDKHERKTEIKAITFHKMDVKRTSHVELQAIVDL